MRRVLACLLVLLGLLAGPMAAAANAATVQPATPRTTTITLTGSISAGRDYAGLFGPWGRNLSGKTFTATYTVVTFANSSVGAGIDMIGLGGASLPAPTTMAFSMTINGRTQTGHANSFGSIESEDGVGGAFVGGFDRVQTSAVETTNLGSFSKTFDLSATVQSTLHSILSDNKSLNAMPSTSYTVAAGDFATGRFQISQSVSPSVLSYGLLSIDHVTVVNTPEMFPPVPEPGEWAMMLAGLAVVGAVGRRRRR